MRSSKALLVLGVISSILLGDIDLNLSFGTLLEEFILFSLASKALSSSVILLTGDLKGDLGDLVGEEGGELST